MSKCLFLSSVGVPPSRSPKQDDDSQSSPHSVKHDDEDSDEDNSDGDSDEGGDRSASDSSISDSSRSTATPGVCVCKRTC